MENISSKAELSERYTNHCIRASTITALYQRGVDAKQICAITKHKDERSLSHYISQTTSEKKGNAPGFCKKRFMDIRLHSFANTAESFSLFTPAIYPNCTQHIQIGTTNVYHGAGPSQPTDHSDCKPAKRRRIIIESDSD